MDRVQACNKYLEEHPEDAYSRLHVVADDDNVDDYFILVSISDIADALADDAELSVSDDHNAALWRQFRFLVSLLDLPLPDWWDEENDG